MSYINLNKRTYKLPNGNKVLLELVYKNYIDEATDYLYNLDLEVSTATLVDASNGLDGLATAKDVYDIIIENELVTAAALTTLNDIILEVSANCSKNCGNNSSSEGSANNNLELSPIGSNEKHIYIDNDGNFKESTYFLNKSVPNDAKFTDTIYYAGNNINIDNSNKISAIGYTYDRNVDSLTIFKGNSYERYTISINNNINASTNPLYNTGITVRYSSTNDRLYFFYSDITDGDIKDLQIGLKCVLRSSSLTSDVNAYISLFSEDLVGFTVPNTENCEIFNNMTFSVYAYNYGAFEKYQFVNGYDTIALNLYEIALGKYNLSHYGNTIFSIGDGTSNITRKNAFEIDKDGYIYIRNLDSASYKYNGTNGNDYHNSLQYYLTKFVPTLYVNKTGDDMTGDLTTTGKIIATNGFYQTSDKRKKNIISDISLDKCYKFIDNVNPVNYELKDNNSILNIGLVALEVKEIFPELVSEDVDGFLSVDYAKLSVVLLKVVKDLSDKINK